MDKDQNGGPGYVAQRCQCARGAGEGKMNKAPTLRAHHAKSKETQSQPQPAQPPTEARLRHESGGESYVSRQCDLHGEALKTFGEAAGALAGFLSLVRPHH